MKRQLRPPRSRGTKEFNQHAKYWRFQERDGGTWIESEAISLTRDEPTGLGWIVEPIIKNLPRNSLRNPLESTRTALVK